MIAKLKKGQRTLSGAFRKQNEIIDYINKKESKSWFANFITNAFAFQKTKTDL